MAHVQHKSTCAPTTQTRKTTTGGLTLWRESLVKQLILDRLSDPLEVTELARACALSRSHFSRTFKCSTGLSPQDWIRCQRIARAKQLIEKTNLTLTQIGLECGFCDQAHFCHIFTRSEGITPFAWRCRAVRSAPPTATQAASLTYRSNSHPMIKPSGMTAHFQG
jgi:transcriptional regulator GlxA family with amidase domain